MKKTGCEVCSAPTSFTYDVLGERVLLCDKHGKAWLDLGPMATMIAYVMLKLRERESK